MKTLQLKRVALVALFTPCLFACEGIGGQGSEPLLTPDEQKEKLESVTLSFVDAIELNGIEEVIEAIEDASYILEDTPTPPNFDEVMEDIDNEFSPDPYEDITLACPACFTKSLSRAVEGGQLLSTTQRLASLRSGEVYSIYSHLKKLKGKYTLNSHNQWDEGVYGSGVKLVFDNYTLAVDFGKEISVEVESEGAFATLLLPGDISLTFTENGKELLVITLDVSDLTATNEEIDGDCSASIELAGYKCTADQEVKFGTANTDLTLQSGSNTILTLRAEVDGIEAEALNQTGTIASAEVTVGFMNNLYLTGAIDDLATFATDAEEAGDYEELASIYNDNLSLSWNFKDSASKQGSVKFEAVDNEIIPYLAFNDDSKSSLEQFFNEEDFEEVLDALDGLMDDLDDLDL